MDSPNLPKPKVPSSLLKVSRWSLLALGFVYGKTRYTILKKKEDELRCREEMERPAKEAAMKAERERKNAEEMAYLAQQAGVPNSGYTGAASTSTSGGGGKGGDGGSGGGSGPNTCNKCNQPKSTEEDPCKKVYKSACGCSY